MCQKRAVLGACVHEPMSMCALEQKCPQEVQVHVHRGASAGQAQTFTLTWLEEAAHKHVDAQQPSATSDAHELQDQAEVAGRGQEMRHLMSSCRVGTA